MDKIKKIYGVVLAAGESKRMGRTLGNSKLP